ncbi:MAG: hypothetical protein KDD60_11915, partial [Bdellovibrionales bacterium]|nr:hypothetical protein [Bdellovibrionales bacterium]
IEAEVIILPKGEDPDSFAHEHRGNLLQVLGSLERRPLFDCYVEYLIREKTKGRVGTEAGQITGSDLPPSQKGTIAEEIVRVLQGVDNPVERDELMRRSAFLLQIDDGALRKFFEPEKSGRKSSLSTSPSSSSPPASIAVKTSPNEDSQPDVVKSPYQLKEIEKLFLRCVMVLRKRALKDLESLPEVLTALSISSQMFCELFREVLDFESDDRSPSGSVVGELRNAIQGVLASMGPEWIRFWKESHKMSLDPEVNFDKMWRECLIGFEKERISSMISEMGRVLAAETNLEEQSRVLSGRISLERQLRTLQASVQK